MAWSTRREGHQLRVMSSSKSSFPCPLLSVASCSGDGRLATMAAITDFVPPGAGGPSCVLCVYCCIGLEQRPPSSAAAPNGHQPLDEPNMFSLCVHVLHFIAAGWFNDVIP